MRCALKEQLKQQLNGGTFNGVKITFDPAKRRAALSERGLNFAGALIVFAGPTITKTHGAIMAKHASRRSDFLVTEW
jgi:hypothetical protein